MRTISRPGAAGVILIALSACSGSTETTSAADARRGSGFSDASGDCEGCEYVLRGLERPNRLWVAADYLYVEDWPAGKLYRLPLTGGETEVVSEGVAPLTFAVTETHLYFVATDPIDEGSSNVYRVEHASGEREHVVRFEDAGETMVGMLGDAVVLKASPESGPSSLLTVEPSGQKQTLREWPGSESPTAGCVRVLEDAELVWCDREDGLWSAPSVSAEGVHQETGWLASAIHVTAAGLLVASTPIGEHSIYLRDAGGELTKIAASSEPIGSPRYPLGSGVVWIQGGVRFTGLDGETVLLTDSHQVLSTPPEGLAVSSEHVFFTGHRGAEPWSVYRIAAPR